MGRPRIKTADAEILAMAAQGQSAEKIAATIREKTGQEVSAMTIRRRLGSKRASAKLSPKRGGKGSLPAVAPEVVDAGPPQTPADFEQTMPDVTNAEIADKWMRELEGAAKAAKDRGDFASFATLMRLVAAFLEQKRKNAPVVLPDPNEAPDMVEAAKQACKKLNELLEHPLLETWFEG